MDQQTGLFVGGQWHTKVCSPAINSAVPPCGILSRGAFEVGALLSVAVAIAGGFTAEIADLGDRREISVVRRVGTEVYHEVTTASFDACIRRFAAGSAGPG